MMKAANMIKAVWNLIMLLILTGLYFVTHCVLWIVCVISMLEYTGFSPNIHSVFPYIFLFGIAMVMSVATLYRKETEAFVEIVDTEMDKVGKHVETMLNRRRY